jgi:PilZ domain-containing protein
MEDRRRHQRSEIDEPGYISVDGSSTSCRVRNVSNHGAAIDVPIPPSYVPDRFQLMTEGDRIIRNCRTVWISGKRIGVAFE